MRQKATILFAAALLVASCGKEAPETPAPEMPTAVLEQLSFEHFKTVETKPSYGYHVFYEEGADGASYDLWASGNEGAAMVNSKRKPEKFPTYATADGYEGYGVCLNTQSSGTLGGLVGKPIAAGNLYIGSFDSGKVMSDALKTTVFGVPVDREPVSVSGWYKYSPGKTFTDKNKKEIPDRTDEANIYGVFWRNTDGGKKVTLHGDNILDNPWIVSKAQVAELPPTEEWAQFEMFFEGERADAEVLAQRGYSFTLVFSSSKGGDSFEGAIGSTLMIDELRVSFAPAPEN